MSEDRSNLKKKILSVVVSVYNEEQALEECYTEMKRVLDTLSWDHELIFVNDGSSDGFRVSEGKAYQLFQKFRT